MKQALLIIDVQNAMIAVDNPVYHADNAIRNIQSLITKAKNKNIPIIYVQHNENEGEFKTHTLTWQIFDGIKPSDEDIIIQKFESDAFYQTNLKEVLDNLSIDQLVIAGMQTDHCVNATSTRAVELGYLVTIIKDAHSTWESDGISAEEIINTHHLKWSKNMILVNEKEFIFQ